MKCPYCNKEFLAKEAQIRSTPENRYYWGVVVSILSDELGYQKFEVHEILKAMFLQDLKILKTKNGIKEVHISKSTASLRIAEFEEYLDNIRMWALLDMGVVIPLPNHGDDDVDVIFKSTFDKRMELINLILDSGYTGSTEDWLYERNIKLEELTDDEIDKIIWAINETKT